jgi:polysaccharide export outer membrane protein
MLAKQRLLLCVLALFSLSGCGTILAVPMAADEGAPDIIDEDYGYSLATGDTVTLTVYGEEELTGEYTIGADGAIALPLVGNVPAAGLNKNELASRIAKTLRKEGYLNQPLVTVDSESLRPIYILGEVRNPGSYPWQPNFDVFKAVASAGGYTPRAAKGLVLIDRMQGRLKMQLNGNERTPLLPGDSVVVRERIF